MHVTVLIDMHVLYQMLFFFSIIPGRLDGIPIGHYAYPFQCPLQQEIPGMYGIGQKFLIFNCCKCLIVLFMCVFTPVGEAEKLLERGRNSNLRLISA